MPRWEQGGGDGHTEGGLGLKVAGYYLLPAVHGLGQVGVDCLWACEVQAEVTGLLRFVNFKR